MLIQKLMVLVLIMSLKSLITIIFIQGNMVIAMILWEPKHILRL